MSDDLVRARCIELANVLYEGQNIVISRYVPECDHPTIGVLHRLKSWPELENELIAATKTRIARLLAALIENKRIRGLDHI